MLPQLVECPLHAVVVDVGLGYAGEDDEIHK